MKFAASHPRSPRSRFWRGKLLARVAVSPRRILFLAGALGFGCGGPASLTVDMPLHLEEHLEEATVVGSVVPADRAQPIEWRFDEPQPEWKAAAPWTPTIRAATLTRTDDALRISLTEGTKNPRGDPVGGIELKVPGWSREDWAHLVVRARTSDEMRFVISFNRRQDSGTATDFPYPYQHRGDAAPLISDGSVQTYVMRADWSREIWGGEWTELGLWFRAPKPASIDILSISLIPKEANYGEAGVGVREESRDRVYRRAIYTHAPGRLEYRVRIPEGGRLDVGLGVLRDDAPVTFRVAAGRGGETERLFEETYAVKDGWGQRSVDLSDLAGETVTLALETESERPGTVAFWGAPTLAGSSGGRGPNVIFYVIDGGAADFMSVYGYNRRTTPNIERLAAQGALFERAYSNASWTRPSTASFMTSLQNSVLGGFLNWNDPIPEQAVTMAQRMHRAGYQTAVFTANPNAGSLSDLKRGVDQFRENWDDFSYTGGGNHRESSRFLHEGFWAWRQAYPAQPYWAHFQTTDVHEDFPAVAPFAGLFVPPQDRETWRAWDDSLSKKGSHDIYSESWDSTGISRTAFFSLHQGLYDETMAHNDYQLGRLVERLKATGEWENTLLIIGADHSTSAAMDDMVALLDSLPPRWGHPMFRPTITRVPLIFVWPGHIEAGQRFSEPVSMIDVFPTLLDLLGLAPLEVAQGQSLAPLLRGEPGWTPRPVILDEFELDRETNELRGLIEVVDGRWGASLEINPRPPKEDDDEEDVARRRPVPLLLYDLWNDPFCITSVHAEHPDLVEKYTAFLQEQWQAHQSLAQLFSPPDEAVALTPQQLEALRALGYIR